VARERSLGKPLAKSTRNEAQTQMQIPLLRTKDSIYWLVQLTNDFKRNIGVAAASAFNLSLSLTISERGY